MDDTINTKIEKLKENGKEIKKEIWQQTISYIIAAFGLVAGLAWNEAIKALIDYLFPLGENTLLAKFIYAISMTLIVVIITIYLMKFSSRKK
jgi:septation ring formation regulator EzrA